jgi:predicted ribosomally synthesized peptide with SipW-like signal peptide
MIKIINSLAIVTFVAVIAIGGTIAYFSDTEKSTGNTFTAGEFNLTIDSECHFNGAECICRAEGQSYAGECYWDIGGNGEFGDGEVSDDNRCYCTWDAKDLTDEKFFNLANLIPGDQGEVTISMHVEGDDYYVRSKVDNVWNKDNGCNDAETKAGDTNCGDWGGELGANMDFAFWADIGSIWGYQNDDTDPQEGDNIINSAYEYGTLGITSGDDATGDWTEIQYLGNYLKLRDGATYYMGAAWCVGDLSVDPTSYAITCNGSTAGNIIQTDSYSSDMTFEVVQATHNNSANPFGI